MSLKTNVLKILLSGEVISGELLARRLGVSRAAVWKAIRSLSSDGYKIEAQKGQGYRLEASSVITEEGLFAHLSEGCLPEDTALFIYDLTDSTSTRAKLYAEGEDAKKNAIFIASGQTDGRGRRGRTFLSNRGAGLYISLLTHPNGDADKAVSITTYTAVAVCRALERITSLSPRIKWVNDVYVGGKKLCGILTEGSVDMESGELSYAVSGIGINVYPSDMGELSDIAVDIETASGERVDMSALAAAVIEEFFSGLSNIGSGEIAEEYRRRSLLIGREVRVIKLSGEYTATVLGITDDGRLHIRLADGTDEMLVTGEVSLKLG